MTRQPKSQHGLATKQAILEATSQIVLSTGLESVNTNWVAEKAGISVGSLYQYYKNKDEILLELLQYSIDRRLQRVKDALSAGLSHSSLEEIVSTVVDALFDNEAVPHSADDARLELALFPIVMASRQAIWRAQIQKVNDLLKPLIKALLLLKEPGFKHRDLDAVSFLLMQATRGAMIGLAMPHGTQIKQSSLKKELKHLFLGFLRPLPAADG